MPQQAFAGLMCSTIGVASKHSNTNKIDAENGVSKLSEAAKEERKKLFPIPPPYVDAPL